MQRLQRLKTEVSKVNDKCSGIELVGRGVEDSSIEGSSTEGGSIEGGSDEGSKSVMSTPQELIEFWICFTSYLLSTSGLLLRGIQI